MGPADASRIRSESTALSLDRDGARGNSERAKGLGLDAAAFDACLESGKHAARVKANEGAGGALGVSGTPAFFVGRTSADGTIEAMPIRGAQQEASFRKVIDALLDGKPAS